jgi:hypothetical protein
MPIAPIQDLTLVEHVWVLASSAVKGDDVLSSRQAVVGSSSQYIIGTCNVLPPSKIKISFS